MIALSTDICSRYVCNGWKAPLMALAAVMSPGAREASEAGDVLCLAQSTEAT